MNDTHHGAVIDPLNCITLHSDLVHFVGILKITDGRSWTSRRMSWMRKGEEVQIYISKNSVWIVMQ